MSYNGPGSYIDNKTDERYRVMGVATQLETREPFVCLTQLPQGVPPRDAGDILCLPLRDFNKDVNGTELITASVPQRFVRVQ